jgi:YgiT-type zinc finger domain-containing protein
MKCVICKHDELEPGIISILFEQDGCTIVMKEVPANNCNNCGESYVDDKVAQEILDPVNTAVHQGIVVDMRKYTPDIMAVCS